MRTLRLGMRGLPASDEHLIRNLMRMFAHDPMFHWELSDEDVLDVLVLDANPLQDVKPNCCYRIALLLSEVDMPGDENVLTRPLQASAFRDWLLRAELALSQPSTVPTDALPERRPSHRSRHARKPLRFKLRNWPPRIMLRGDPMLLRLTQLLSADSFGVSELAQLSGASITACQDFLRKLQLLGLLDISVPKSPVDADAGHKPSWGERLHLVRERFMRARV